MGIDRRTFLKYSTAGITAPFWLQYCDFPRQDFPVKLNSDHETGHLIFGSQDWKVKQGKRLDVAIVGGGVAGLTAAYQVRDLNFELFELSHSLGGSVSCESYQNVQFSQGAHYDLAYPEHYGTEVIALLEELNLVRYEAWNKAWSFTDQQHIIPPFRRQQCYDFGKIRRDVIPESRLKDQFVALIHEYQGEMRLPSRMIDAKHHALNDLTFSDFLKSSIAPNEAFLRQVDYHMYDDYGGPTKMVSALAGIHYFACRPYYKQDVALFSPPNGNKYFADALIENLDTNRLKRSHLVKKIAQTSQGYELQVINVEKQWVEVIQANKVIYAGQKHALKYIFPDQENLFSNTYSPWMVVNLIAKQEKGTYGYWQNEFLGENENFLGFIDSSVQLQEVLKGKRVFTGYYCLHPKDREYLTTINAAKEGIASETKGYIETFLGTKIEVEACFIKVMGHAIPLPKPGYLFQDVNASDEAKMIYAGVDTNRLPLLYEALDSGIQAASLV